MTSGSCPRARTATGSSSARARAPSPAARAARPQRSLHSALDSSPSPASANQVIALSAWPASSSAQPSVARSRSATAGSCPSEPGPSGARSRSASAASPAPPRRSNAAPSARWSSGSPRSSTERRNATIALSAAPSSSKLWPMRIQASPAVGRSDGSCSEANVRSAARSSEPVAVRVSTARIGVGGMLARAAPAATTAISASRAPTRATPCPIALTTLAPPRRCHASRPGTRARAARGRRRGCPSRGARGCARRARGAAPRRGRTSARPTR